MLIRPRKQGSDAFFSQEEQRYVCYWFSFVFEKNKDVFISFVFKILVTISGPSSHKRINPLERYTMVQEAL